MAEQKFTRCPGCKTIFRVTPAQLAMRGGQVRCGHCRTVFDGVAALLSLAPQRRAERRIVGDDEDDNRGKCDEEHERRVHVSPEGEFEDACARREGPVERRRQAHQAVGQAASDEIGPDNRPRARIRSGAFERDSVKR